MSKEISDLKKIAISIVEHFCTKEEPARTNNINKILNTDEFKRINRMLKNSEQWQKDYYDLVKRYQNICEERLQWKNKERALKIIKEKRVDVPYLQECENLKQYNDFVEMNWSCRKEAEYHNEILTQEEFDLLKEVLK